MSGNQPNEAEEAARMDAAQAADPYQHPRPDRMPPASLAGNTAPQDPERAELLRKLNADLKSQPAKVQVWEPPPEQLPPRYLDIPVGSGSDRRLASIPFGISEGDLEMIEQMIDLWRERLTRK